MKDKIEISVKKIVMLSVVMVTITAVLIGFGTYAYFSASQVSGVNDFVSGSISFSVDGNDPWTGNFNATLTNLQPGMISWGNVSVRNTGTNPADFWMNVTNVSTSSFGTNTAKSGEPAATDIDGVIRYGLYNYTTGSAFPPMWVTCATYTISPGSHQLTGLTTGVRDQWIYLGVIQPGAANEVFVNESFTMDSATTNWAQLTNMTFTVNFYAQQSQGTPRPAAPANELPGHARV